MFNRNSYMFLYVLLLKKLVLEDVLHSFIGAYFIQVSKISLQSNPIFNFYLSPTTSFYPGEFLPHSGLIKVFRSKKRLLDELCSIRSTTFLRSKTWPLRVLLPGEEVRRLILQFCQLFGLHQSSVR
jgi:hypothetical protein